MRYPESKTDTSERPRLVLPRRWLALTSVGLVVATVYYGALAWGVFRAGQAVLGW